jgi:spore coat protein CotH
LFDPPRVIPLSFDVPAAELAAMLKGSHKYGRCTMHAGNLSLADVGIRYKGNPAKEAGSGKPDFNLEFNEFVSGQQFHGLKRLILLAGRDDPSYLSAPIGLELFREAGVPAARCGFVRVRLNDRDLGLYLLVEGVDRDFIGRHFAKSNGNLYDEGDHTDVDGKLEKYGDPNGTDQSDVDALAAAAKQPDPRQRWQQLQRLLEVDRFVSFIAVEVLLWQKDSYAIKARKFRIYHDPTTDRLVFFPKNVEEVFGKVDGQLMPDWQGVVARAVLTTPEGRALYLATVDKLLATGFTPDKVETRARTLAAVIRPTVVGTDAVAARKFDAAVSQFCDTIARRSDFVAGQLKTASASGGRAKTSNLLATSIEE